MHKIFQRETEPKFSRTPDFRLMYGIFPILLDIEPVTCCESYTIVGVTLYLYEVMTFHRSWCAECPNNLQIPWKFLENRMNFLSLIIAWVRRITLSLTSWGPLKAVLGRFSSFTFLSVGNFFGRLARGPENVINCYWSTIHPSWTRTFGWNTKGSKRLSKYLRTYSRCQHLTSKNFGRSNDEETINVLQFGRHREAQPQQVKLFNFCPAMIYYQNFGHAMIRQLCHGWVENIH